VAAVHYRTLPERWLLFDQFRSDLAIRDVHIPVLIVHGDDDRVIPINLAKRLTFRAGINRSLCACADWIDTRRGEAPLWHRARVSARLSVHRKPSPPDTMLQQMEEPSRKEFRALFRGNAKSLASHAKRQITPPLSSPMRVATKPGWRQLAVTPVLCNLPASSRVKRMLRRKLRGSSKGWSRHR
jgi:hypothetical protein